MARATKTATPTKTAAKAKTVTTAAAQPTATLNLGIDPEKLPGMLNILSKLLADEMVLYAKLRNYHWNVTGPHFHSLHEMFEDQYTQIAEVVDEVAERIRQYGANAPGTLAEFIQLTRLSEHPGTYPNAKTMVGNAVADHESLIRFLRADIEEIDDEADDVGAEDLLTGLLQQHQKMAWMLRTYLEAGE